MIAAVIGHGKSPVGKGWGERIDSCDIILRMWDWQWQDLPDWGDRYDYGFLEMLPYCMDLYWKYNRYQPRLGWVASELKKVNRLPPRCVVVDPIKWENVGKAMGGLGKTGNLRLQRGAAAACWMIEQPEVKQVILVGFDNAHAGISLSIKDGYPDTYVDQPSTFPWRAYEGGLKKFGNHDYEIERPLLEKLAAQAQVDLKFAQDMNW